MLKPTPKKPHKWNSQRQGFLDSLHYLQGRMRGEIKSFKTPWPKVNDATTDGFEWHNVTVIGGRPGSGKTLIKDQIIREGFKLNASENFRVLEFQLEMLARTSAIREFSSVLGKSYKYLCSADGKISEEHLKMCYEYAKERVKYPIDVVEEPCTVKEFKEIICAYMEEHAITETVRQTFTDPNGKPYDKDVQNKIYKKTMVTLDHSLLLKRNKEEGERDKHDTLYALGEALTELKRKYPIHFLILSQLNRGVDSPERNEDGKYGNYILESDIFGADALLQHADTLIGINKPAKQKIKYYGPDRYIIEDDTLVFHFLKCRNGDTRMSFFKAEFTKMKVSEIPTPGQQEKRLKT